MYLFVKQMDKVSATYRISGKTDTDVNTRLLRRTDNVIKKIKVCI